MIVSTNKALIQHEHEGIDLKNSKEVHTPLYINKILLVNKDYALPQDFNPGNNKDMLDAFSTMQKAAKKDGIILNIGSSFRSFPSQFNLYSNYKSSVGKKNTDTFSAPPGHSEHQTGLAIDIIGSDSITNINDKFNNTLEAKWLGENAYKYGFILRYPKGKENITGYKYESWHYRYVGIDHSLNFNNNSLTLEEYLGLA